MAELSQTENLYELRKDYADLLHSYKSSQQQHQQQLQAMRLELESLRQLSQRQNQQLRQSAVVMVSMQSQLQEKKQALLYAQERCINSQENFYKLELEVKRMKNTYSPDKSVLERLGRLELQLAESIRQVEEVTDIAAHWKEKFQRLQRDRRGRERQRDKENEHPLVQRMREMVRVAGGLDYEPSAKESWQWVKRLVNEYLKRGQ